MPWTRWDLHFVMIKRCVLATDLGVVTPQVEAAMHNAQVLILESNHDLDMLHRGPYPLAKRRIRSPKGHLSNHDAGKVLSQLKRNEPMHVFLAPFKPAEQ